MPSINLVAVQPNMARADYRDAAAFHARITGFMQRVAREADLSLPTLVSFPELIGMYLTFVPTYWDDLSGEKSLEAAATKIVMKNFERVPQAERTPEAAARRLLFIEPALEAERVYTGVFSLLAREYRVYLAAGSIALPPIESEPSKGGRHVMDASRVYNTSYLFSPTGRCLRTVPKVYMTPGFEERVFDCGPKSELVPVDTRLGRLGTLVCFDGFHETLVEHYDAMGVRILLKPSYNMHPWDSASSYDASCKEGDNWLRTGLPSIIQGRENIRYGVNAMLVGAVFEDTAAEGLSSIAVNTGRTDATWEDGVVAIASRPDAEEVLVAAVEADWLA